VAFAQLETFIRPNSSTAILVVEDHDILREGLQILLEVEGYQVTTACNGLDALQRMERCLPHLILSDITMPEMDGLTFYQKVRSLSSGVTIPFIFLTALGEPDAVLASRQLGAEDYLVKPVERQELLATIRSRLDRSQQLMLHDVEESYESSLIMLANAIELQDEYTGAHVERVMELAIGVARRLDWSEAQIRPLRFGAILHDIGKIYIPENILRKPGKLTAAEWEIMKQHTIMGEDLLRSIDYLESALPVIRWHHERWDGRGYPDGLKGEEIPMAARIVSVVDCYDAMTTVRAYHTAADPGEVLQEILAGSGARYDPVVVQAFLEDIGSRCIG
jgi:putative two-component system response regulator